MNTGPIVIVEDDEHDCRFLVEALNIIGVKNPLQCFDNAIKALEYLRSTKEIPFLIISDINLPMMTGLEFKQAINTDAKLSRKQIPFIFLSTLPPAHYIKVVKRLSVEGHFKKPDNFEELIHIIKSIIDSWQRVESMTG